MSIDLSIRRREAGPAGRQRGWWYPWLFVAAFAVVIAVNGVMIKLAVDSFSGLDTARPYERGLDYDDTLAAARAQEAMGWQVEFDAALTDRGLATGRTVAVTTRFLDRDGRALTGLAVRAFLLRPAVEGHDIELELTEQGNGRYAAEAAVPLAGQWDLRIVARDGGTAWQASRRILLP